MYILVFKISRDIYLYSLLTVQQIHQIDITKQGKCSALVGIQFRKLKLEKNIKLLSTRC